MEVNSFFIFAFLCVCTVTSSLAYSIKDTVSNNDLRLNDLECTNGMWTNKRKLSNLSVGCQSKIVEKIDIRGLTKMDVINNNYLNFSTGNFNKKFANKSIRIGREIDSYYLIVDENISYEVKIDSVYLLLEHFGEFISSLEIIFGKDRSDAHLKKCIEYANQYCKNLRKFTVLYGIGVLNDVKGPFHNVTEAIFYAVHFEIHTLNLKQMFPNVEYLVLSAVKIEDDDFLVHSLPKLNYLDVSYFYFEPIMPNYRQIQKLVEKNPQIQGLDIDAVPMNLVKFIHDYLPNLKTLRLSHIEENDNTIPLHFKNVKIFSAWKCYEGITNITFEQLDELDCTSSAFPIWLDTVKSHPNLRKLLMHSDFADNERISLISQIARNLIETSFRCRESVQVGTIVNFLNDCKHMQKLYLFEFRKEYVDILERKIQDKWNLSKLEARNSLLIERK